MLAHNQALIYARGTKGLSLVRAQRQIEATSNKTRHSTASDTREDSETRRFLFWRGGMHVPDIQTRGGFTGGCEQDHTRHLSCV